MNIIERVVTSGAAVVLALGLAASANAEIVTVTYNGVVKSGSDQTGVFGTPGGNLAGASYTAVYTIDDSGKHYADDQPGILNDLFGGTHYNNQSPVSAIITINGFTAPFAGVYRGVVWQATLAFGHSEIFYSVEDEKNDGSTIQSDYMENKFFSFVDPIVSSEKFDTPLSYTLQPKDYSAGYFVDTLRDIASGNYLVNVNAQLVPTSLIVELGTPAVPEPATWAMLILGVGMIGFAARRRGAGAAIAA